MRSLQWHIGDVIRKLRGTTSAGKLGIRGGTLSALELRGDSYNYERDTILMVIAALNKKLPLKPGLTEAELFQLVPVSRSADVTSPVTDVRNDAERTLLDRYRALPPERRAALLQAADAMQPGENSQATDRHDSADHARPRSPQ